MKLLVIEDEPALLKSITKYFEQENILCETATTFDEGLRKIEMYQYDCILLDINLPGGTGLSLLRYIRENKNSDGVIIISARNSLYDKVAGLNMGADDYLAKPFHMSELNARFKALIRRKHGQGLNIFSSECLVIDMSAKTATINNEPVILTKCEYDLLFFLVINRNRVVSRQAIAEHLFGQEADNLNSFDFVYSHIKNLKKKIKEKCACDIIKTVYGLGYKLTV